MTYIAAFPCKEGYVCCADTLENRGEEKQYVEKLAAYGDGEYPFCIGGAGTGEIIDALTQEISERILRVRPQGCEALATEIKSAVKDVYTNDVPVMALKTQLRTAELLVAANSRSGDTEFYLFHIKGRRVFKLERGIIGYATATNQALLKRFHDDKMPMSQAVILAVYLVSQSKLTDADVDGDTRVGMVSQFSAKIEDKEYIESIEARIKDFLSVTDLLFLHLSDTGLSRFEFENKLHKFVDLLQIQREAASEHVLKYLQFLADSGSLNKINWAYSKIPLGTRFGLFPDPSGRMKVSLVNDVDEMWKQAREKAQATLSGSQTSEDQQSPCDEECPRTDQNDPGD
jgi:20S proteasome alpha/beta subunit